MLGITERDAMEKAKQDLESATGRACRFAHENTDNPGKNRCKVAEANIGCAHSGQHRLLNAFNILTTCDLLSAEEKIELLESINGTSQELSRLDFQASVQYMHANELSMELVAGQQKVIDRREQVRQFLLNRLSIALKT